MRSDKRCMHGFGGSIIGAVVHESAPIRPVRDPDGGRYRSPASLRGSRSKANFSMDEDTLFLHFVDLNGLGVRDLTPWQKGT